MTTTPDPIAAYGAAWLESDETRRSDWLRLAWSDDAIYCDPIAFVAGRDALVQHIGDTQASLAGGRVMITSEPVRHHDSAFFRWAITDAGGTEVLTGWDVVQLADDGRIVRLTGFFDPDTERR